MEPGVLEENRCWWWRETPEDKWILIKGPEDLYGEPRSIPGPIRQDYGEAIMIPGPDEVCEWSRKTNRTTLSTYFVDSFYLSGCDRVCEDIDSDRISFCPYCGRRVEFK